MSSKVNGRELSKSLKTSAGKLPTVGQVIFRVGNRELLLHKIPVVADGDDDGLIQAVRECLGHCD